MGGARVVVGVGKSGSFRLSASSGSTEPLVSSIWGPGTPNIGVSMNGDCPMATEMSSVIAASCTSAENISLSLAIAGALTDPTVGCPESRSNILPIISKTSKALEKAETAPKIAGRREGGRIPAVCGDMVKFRGARNRGRLRSMMWICRRPSR